MLYNTTAWTPSRSLSSVAALSWYPIKARARLESKSGFANSSRTLIDQQVHELISSPICFACPACSRIQHVDGNRLCAQSIFMAWMNCAGSTSTCCWPCMPCWPTGIQPWPRGCGHPRSPGSAQRGAVRFQAAGVDRAQRRRAP